MPEIIYDTQEAIPEDIRGDAVAKDGKFAVNVVSSKKLDEFRTNNVNLSKERDTYQTIFGRLKTDIGFDPEKVDDFVTTFKDLSETKTLVENGKLIKDTSLDEAVTKRTGEMKSQHQVQINALETSVRNYQGEVEKLQNALNDTVIDREISGAVGNEKSGVRPDAINAVIREARDFFKVRDGKLVPLDHDGNVIYGADGTSPMTPLEWIKTRLIESAPYVFKASSGGGAGGGNSALGGLSSQQLSELTPAERMRMAREAGR